MTRAELATFITTKMSLTDAASVAFCKDAINRRYQMIWDGNTWRETLGIASKAVSASQRDVTFDGASEVSFYQNGGSSPSAYIDIPLAVKVVDSNDGQDELVVEDWNAFFQIDPGAFDNVASRMSRPRNFIVLPKDSSGYARVRIVPGTDAAATVWCLGKLRFQELSDSHSPVLRGVENALLAYVEGDMLERSRQYGKAQAKYAEGAAHVQTMREMERSQMASNQRIIPTPDQSYDPICSPD